MKSRVLWLKGRVKHSSLIHLPSLADYKILQETLDHEHKKKGASQNNG